MDDDLHSAVPANSTIPFWDALAPHLAWVEDNYLDARSARRLAGRLKPPVLIIGAGQGLIVAEIRRKGIQCDGVDWSTEMIKFAKL